MVLFISNDVNDKFQLLLVCLKLIFIDKRETIIGELWQFSFLPLINWSYIHCYCLFWKIKQNWFRNCAELAKPLSNKCHSSITEEDICLLKIKSLKESFDFFIVWKVRNWWANLITFSSKMLGKTKVPAQFCRLEVLYLSYPFQKHQYISYMHV